MIEREVPFTAWTLTPQHKPVQTEFDRYGGYGMYRIARSTKHLREEQFHPTKEEAIAYGERLAVAQQEKIDRMLVKLGKQKANLAKARG